MRCPNCSQTFIRRRVDQGFCSAACNREDDRRALTRARRVYKVLYRIFSKRKYAERGADFTFLYREVRSWIVEDQLRQRLAPPAHDHTADRGHQRQDRKAA